MQTLPSGFLYVLPEDIARQYTFCPNKTELITTSKANIQNMQKMANK
jgi:hypothetical protein